MAFINSLPLVSIGMPVYNGGKVLRRALDSILAQDYPNFELIISDNASTDETSEICREFALRDCRILYHRTDRNMGVVWNFNRVVELSKGKYFMRMSHDDFRAPAYLSKCVDLLESNDNAVLCHSYTAAFYGDITNVLTILTHDSMTGIQDPGKRFIEALKHLPGSALDAVFRTETLKTKTRPMENHIASDVVFTHELTLYGEFVQVPEILFWRSGRAVLPNPREIYPIYGIGKRISKLFYYPFLTVAASHARSIFRAPLSVLSKASLLIRLISYEMRTVAIKTVFRTITTLLGEKCPVFIIKLVMSAVDNPNVRLLKHSQDLPPAVQPIWMLLNHRNSQKAQELQARLVEKLFKTERTGKI